MSQYRKRTPIGSARSSWRVEFDQRITWIGNSVVPQLRDPRAFTPSIASSVRLSWISDFVIPQLGTGFEAELEEVDEEATTVPRRQPSAAAASLPRTSTTSLWEKPEEPLVPFPPPSLRRFSPRSGLGSPSRPSQLNSLRSPLPWAARDPGPAPDRKLPPTPTVLTGPRLWLVAGALVFAMFCGGMDRSIVAVATPAITTEFGSLSDVGWYASAYLLTMCSFQLLFGKLYSELSHKYVFLSALAIFEAGSVVSATAQSSLVLIVGRAVAGLGSAGVVSGCIITIGSITHPTVRSAWIGGMAATANIAQALGPLIGGALVTNVSWRWCFWINLPLGGVTVFLILIFLHLPPKPAIPGQSRLKRVYESVDALGTIILVPAIVCLLLALKWGGSEYAWSDWRNMLLLLFFALLFISWVMVQYFRDNRATVPLYLLRSRAITFGGIYSMASYGSLALIMYYVPIWLQAVRGSSALQAGADMLALVLPWAVSLVLSSQLTMRTGYYAPQMLTATVLMSVMAGLMTMWRSDTVTGFWVCTLVFFGVGVGLGMQQPFIATQATLSGPDMALGTSIVMFLQLLSGAILVSVGQNVFLQALPARLAEMAPGIDARAIAVLGAEDLPARLARLYDADQVSGILGAYNAALRVVFVVVVATACVSVLGSLGVEYRNILPPPSPLPSLRSPSAVVAASASAPVPSTPLQERPEHQSVMTFASFASSASLPQRLSNHHRHTGAPEWKEMAPLPESDSEGTLAATQSAPSSPRSPRQRHPKATGFVCPQCMGIPEEREYKIQEED